MSLSVFIILLITCSNLCNCALPVPSEDILKYPQKDEPRHPQKDQPEQKDLEDKRPKEVSVDALKVKGFVQDNHSKKKKHTENEPENVPQHVSDLQAKNPAQANSEGIEHSENKPENVPQRVNNLNNSAQGNPEIKEHPKNKTENVLPLSNEKPPIVINSTKNVTIDTASIGKANDEIRSHKKFNHNVNEMDSSTLKRLVLVLVALSILFIMYLAFKTYRGRNRKSRMMVSKYGVRTRRSDLEMRPLPLDEEEEDETVFEVGNVNNR